MIASLENHLLDIFQCVVQINSESNSRVGLTEHLLYEWIKDRIFQIDEIITVSSNSRSYRNILPSCRGFVNLFQSISISALSGLVPCLGILRSLSFHQISTVIHREALKTSAQLEAPLGTQ